MPMKTPYLALSLILTFAVSTCASDLAFVEADGVRWHDIRQLGVEGQGWTDVASPYDRLPQKAKGVVRDAVWNLSRDSAGIYLSL